MMKTKLSKLQILWLTIQAFTIGLKTPFGFRARLKSYNAIMSMHQELDSLKIKYDFAIKKNDALHERARALHSSATEAIRDAGKMSAALKELANHPTTLSNETKAILDGYKN